ncbi:MAG: antibiotic biosynthesis monooxygenase [Rhodospirillales bacterium]|nr:antibiotic biosynthesis monooxygenase [Rhodospirillales bacterium]
MHVVIFEVEPKAGAKDTYLEIAGKLRQELEKMDGFISIERFQSLADENRMLSLSYWRDEDAISEWRSVANHQRAQAEGRQSLFNDYHIRVAEVVRDYTLADRTQALQPPPENVD